ncbi:MAG: molybdopterin-dependent oxidoreductase [Nitriliruptorales bacterium]|nr:molybdopterin-dependent oxidoreductase [Nitriliruptorales bacterium]
MHRLAATIRRLVRGMAGRQTNLALLGLLLLAVATGALNFALGTAWARWPTVAHGTVALAIVLVSGWKWRIIRAGLDHHPLTSSWPSLVLTALVVAAIASGVLHSTGLVLRYGPLDDMQVHVGAALLSLPFAAWHVFARETFPGRQDATRRNLLRSALLLGSAGAVWASLEGLMDVVGWRGADRRFTGSLEQASHDPESMPSIIWLFDPRLVLDRDAWTLTVVDGSGSRTLGYRELAAPDERVTAILDCTSGWWAEQDWSGVTLSRLLGEPPRRSRSLLVRSETGYARRFPLHDLPHLLLATRYEDRPIAPRHGAPARLVAPGRRGFWWVKWVTRIEVSDVPWWRQPPYPLQ